PGLARLAVCLRILGISGNRTLAAPGDAGPQRSLGDHVHGLVPGEGAAREEVLDQAVGADQYGSHLTGELTAFSPACERPRLRRGDPPGHLAQTRSSRA